jgi:O-antigen/teichoic acid export membrane protein
VTLQAHSQLPSNHSLPLAEGDAKERAFHPVPVSESLSPEIERPIADRSLAHSVFWNAIGDWGSQLLSWAGFLIVVRFVPPSDFGLAAMAILLLPYMNLVTAFGIPRAVVTLRDLTEEQLAQLNSVSLGVSVGCFGVATALAKPLAMFFHSPRLAPVIVTVSTSLLLVGIQGVPAAILAKQLRFRLLTLQNALSSVVSTAITLSLAIAGMGYWALIIGNLLGAVTRCALVLRAQPCRLAIPRLDTVRVPLRFGARIMVSMIASSSYSNLDNFVAGRTLGETALGLYGAAWGLANLPVEKITTLVTTVLPSYLAAIQNRPAVLRRYLLTMTNTIALATFPATVGLGLVARDLVPLLLGPRWVGMAGPLTVLSYYAGFRSIVALLPKYLVAVGEVDFVMWNDLFALILLPVAFYIGSRRGITGVAWGWVIAFPLVAVPLYRKTFRILHLQAFDYMSEIWPALEGTAAMMLFILGSRLALTGTWHSAQRLLFDVFVGGLIYVGVLALRHAERLQSLLQLGRRVFKLNRVPNHVPAKP